MLENHDEIFVLKENEVYKLRRQNKSYKIVFVRFGCNLEKPLLTFEL